MAAPLDARTGRLTGARGVLTQILRGLLWLVVAGVVVQVFLAGLFNFGEASARETHEGVGWTVHTAGMVALVLAVFGPRTKELMLGTLGLVVLNTVQIMLSTVDTAAVAALHPTLGLAVLALAAWLALRANTGRAGSSSRA
jgi:hypothetical protein